MIDTQLLSQYVESFYGYGNYEGRYWFVGIEEAGAETVADNAERIAIWNRRGRHELEDLVEYHRALGLLDRFLGEKPNIQKTWGRLIRILLAATSEERENWARGVTPTAVRAYQRDLLGRAGGDTCLIELLPLSSKSTGEWMWGSAASPYVRYLSTRKAYQEYCSPKRAEHIAARIKEHKPSAVVFYSVTWTYRKWWERIAGVKLDKISTDGGDFYLGDNGNTVFAIVLHPADRRPKDDYFHMVGATIALRQMQMHAKPQTFIEDTRSSLVANSRRIGMQQAHDIDKFPAARVLEVPLGPDFKVGDRVKHPTFGEGMVLEVKPSGNDQDVSVRFDGVGVKRLLAKVAWLERLRALD